MDWRSASEFFAMGGYGLYVWGSVGATVVLMLGEVAVLVARRRTAWRDAAGRAP